MQKEGNLWRELWETAKTVTTIKQAPLFDEDLAVEGILNDLEDIPPFALFEQLFVSLVYEIVEMMILKPKEAEQPQQPRPRQSRW
ncbi:hypothetical protein ACSBR2_029932 [Camellia fascicularis]